MHMDVLVLMATVTLHWTNPQWQADDVCGSNISAPVHLTQTKIQYAYVGGDGIPRTLRMHAATAGQADTMMVPDVPAATYFVTPMNAVGASTCQAASYTVGVPLGVPMPFFPLMSDHLEYMDVRSRRLEGPPSGKEVYFVRYFRNGRLVYTKKVIPL